MFSVSLNIFLFEIHFPSDELLMILLALRKNKAQEKLSIFAWIKHH
jgi:hypothetical protein